MVSFLKHWETYLTILTGSYLGSLLLGFSKHCVDIPYNLCDLFFQNQFLQASMLEHEYCLKMFGRACAFLYDLYKMLKQVVSNNTWPPFLESLTCKYGFLSKQIFYWLPSCSIYYLRLISLNFCCKVHVLQMYCVSLPMPYTFTHSLLLKFFRSETKMTHSHFRQANWQGKDLTQCAKRFIYNKVRNHAVRFQVLSGSNV